MKNKRELNAKLKGATLGDADADVDDTLKWIKKSKKREKELARKRQEELENMDKVFQGADYTESTSGGSFYRDYLPYVSPSIEDLEGLKVSHDFEGMEEGEKRAWRKGEEGMEEEKRGYGGGEKRVWRKGRRGHGERREEGMEKGETRA